MRMSCFAVILFALPILAFTPAETNQVVKSLMSRVMAQAYDDDWTDEPKIILPQQRVDTWETFIGGTIVPGWSFDDKKGAFDWYLSTLGTMDCLNLPQGRKDYVAGAISRCYELHYTNAIPYLQALAFNPRGVHRDLAIDDAIRLGEVDDGMTAFVESIVTNISFFTRSQRGGACGEYSQKLVSLTNGLTASSLRAGVMFYRNRLLDVAGAVAIDHAIVASLPSYTTSSNRLQTASWVLEHSECGQQTRRYFITVTNELLSSDRPLRWINVEGNE